MISTDGMRIVIDLYPATEALKQQLSRYMSHVVLELIDFRSYTVGVVERLTGGCRTHGVSIHELCQDWGIPTEIKEEIDDLVGDIIISQLSTYNTPDPTTHSVEIDSLSNQTLHCTFTPNISLETPIEAMFQKIQTDLDNGDWYSEKIRALVGR